MCDHMLLMEKGQNRVTRVHAWTVPALSPYQDMTRVKSPILKVPGTKVDFWRSCKFAYVLPSGTWPIAL